MAFQHGKSTQFTLDNGAGTPTDISAYVDNVDFPLSIETHETTTFGDSAKDYLPGLKDATISLSGKWDPTLDAHLGTIYNNGGGLTTGNGSLSFVFGPAGSTSGNIKYSGECFLTSFSVSDPVGDLVTWSADLQVTGAVTRGTY